MAQRCPVCPPAGLEALSTYCSMCLNQAQSRVNTLRGESHWLSGPPLLAWGTNAMFSSPAMFMLSKLRILGTVVCKGKWGPEGSLVKSEVF